MKLQTFKKTRIITSIIVAIIVAEAVLAKNIILAIFAVVGGILFLLLVKKKVEGVMVDERVIAISGKAARATYFIVTLTFGISSIIFLYLGSQGQSYPESLGVIFGYTTIFMIAVYSISFKMLSKGYGDEDDQ